MLGACCAAFTVHSSIVAMHNNNNNLIASPNLLLKRRRSERTSGLVMTRHESYYWIAVAMALIILLSSDLCLAFSVRPLRNIAIGRKQQRLWESVQREEKHDVSNAEDGVLEKESHATPEVSRASSSSPKEQVASLLPKQPVAGRKQKMELMWCEQDGCTESIRERAVGEHNHIVLNGPATGQVAYYWSKETSGKNSPESVLLSQKQLKQSPPTTHCVLMLVKQGSSNEALLRIAAEAVTNLTEAHPGVHILLDSDTKNLLERYPTVDGTKLHVFEPVETPGFGDNLNNTENSQKKQRGTDLVYFNDSSVEEVPLLSELAVDEDKYTPDLICTLGGDGLLMHAGMLFQGPTPPILCVSGGSLGFLTPFQHDEMVEAMQVALGLISSSKADTPSFVQDIEVYPPNMPSYPYEPLTKKDATGKKLNFNFGQDDRICLSIRMRLDCRIINREGDVRARYNVLNEVVIDRGISPYLAALECFCDDVHLTTVQADGIIFATPTGSTAYSLAAGSSVVHPAVPCILVTPICPHVLSFRSMVFPDHVVLRCYVPDDARAEASVAFDGKHRQELHRGDSVQIQLSEYPVPTINRKDHSADWLYGLKRDFNFNARTRQGPL